VEKLALPELTTEQTETLCQKAEGTARKHILTHINAKQVETLNVSVEAEGTKPLNLTIEIDLQLTAEAKSIDAKSLADEAAKQALNAAENYLRLLK
jgi:acetylglutamate kinase